MIDLRSDAISHPTEGMRRAMAEAVVGDEQKREDPTVLELERRVADLLGQDDAVFVPSATMANQIALKALTDPGDEVLAEASAHLFRNEAGGPAVHSGLAMGRIVGRAGVFSGDQLRAAVTRNDDPHNAQTTLVCLENTHNSSGGNVWTLEEHLDVVSAARELDLAVHLDGARLLNACEATSVEAAAYGSDCDTVTLCLSKGLGCPVGALLAGREAHVRKARRLKQLFGGGMRQAGVLAAAGLYALDNHVRRLADDREHASVLADGLRARGVPVLNRVRSNIVLIDVGSMGHTRATAIEALARADVLCSKGSREGVLRAMTHLGVSRADVEIAVERIAAALGSSSAQAPSARVCSLSAIKPLNGEPGVRTYPVVGEAAMLNLTEMAPEATIALHDHPNEQVGLVLEGRITLIVSGVARSLGAGDAYDIPAGAPHALTAGPAGARLVDTFHRLREDFRAHADAFAAASQSWSER